MNDFDLQPGIIHRGLGVIGRWPGIVLVVPSDAAHDSVVEELFEQLGSEPAPADVVRLVQDLILERRVLRAAGYLLSATGGPMAMAHGPVEILADGTVIVAGANGPNELHLTDAATRVTIRAANLSKAAEPVPPFDLRRGVVPGAGITLGGRTRSDRTGMTAPPRPEHARAAGGVADDSYRAEPAAIAAPFRSVVLFNREFPPVESAPLPIASDQRPFNDTTNDRPAGGTVGSRPVPTHRGDACHVPVSATVAAIDDDDVIVQGIICSRDHFNNPAAAYCMVCGISMVHVTHNLVPGPRPTLGFVVFDDGSTFGLDRSYLIGREPGEPADRHTAPLTIQDNNETLSRRHAEIRLIDWTVHLIDLGSTNGTFIWDAAYERWNKLEEHQLASLPPGATVALGRRTFVFESVNRT